MLVLGRKKGQEIFIGRDGKIKITVVKTRGDKVLLGIDAPRDVRIYRGEISPKPGGESNGDSGTAAA